MEEKEEFFTVKASAYVRQLFGIWLGKYWWAIALPLLVVLALGLSDSRWLIVALMLLMIVVPGIMALVYFNFALSPQISKRLLRQRIIPNADGFTIEYLSHEESGFCPERETVRYAEIRSIEDMGSTFVVRLKSSPYSIVILPCSAPGAQTVFEGWHNFC